MSHFQIVQEILVSLQGILALFLEFVHGAFLPQDSQTWFTAFNAEYQPNEFHGKRW